MPAIFLRLSLRTMSSITDAGIPRTISSIRAIIIISPTENWNSPLINERVLLTGGKIFVT